MDAEDVAALAILRDQLDTQGQEAMSRVVRRAATTTIHSVMVLLDGGTHTAEVTTLTGLTENGEPLVRAGYQDLFMQHLFDTGRAS